MHSTAEGKLTPVSNLTEFFRDALGEALTHQHVSLDEQQARSATRPSCATSIFNLPGEFRQQRGLAWPLVAVTR
jgi:hypothetical protein